MKISTRGCYGMLAMLDLARKFGQGPVLIRAMADNNDLSRKYLHALLTSLKTAGLVRSVRGSGGGYALTRPPSQISVKAVVRALEGSLSPSECVEDLSLCSRSGACVAHDLWSRMNDIVEAMLEQVSLADLIKTNKTASSGEAIMYQI